MANRLIKLARDTYVPAVQEVIGRPAYCVTTTQRIPVTSYIRTDGSGVGNTFGTGGYDGYGGANVFNPFTTYQDVTTTVCYPAVEAVPGRDAAINSSSVAGWDAGGRSSATAVGDLRAEFVLGASSVGALCGLAPADAPTGQFNTVQHGLLFAGGTIEVVEGGVTKAVSGVSPAGVTLVITRRDGVVRYQVGGWSYTSLVGSTGAVALTAGLYLTGDYVDNPAIAATTSLTAESDWVWSDWSYQSRLTADVTWGWVSSVDINNGYATDSVPVDMAAYDYDYGVLNATLTGDTLVAEGGFRQVDASGVTTVITTSVAAQGTTVVMGSSSTSIPVDMVSAEYDYGFGSVKLVGDAVYGVEFGEAPDTGTSAALLQAGDAYTTDPVLYAALTDTLAVGGVFDVLISMDGATTDYLVVGDAVDAQAVLFAAIESGLAFSDDAASVRGELLQYATNVLTGAVARYSGFGFDGFCSVGLDTYGWKKDGLYKIGADTDNGALISAIVDFAASDFDTAQRKRLDAVFFGLSTDGEILAKVTDDYGDAVTYRVMPRGSEARANTQRGGSSRYWRLQLQIIDATYAELDNVEWVVGSTGRRTTR